MKLEEIIIYKSADDKIIITIEDFYKKLEKYNIDENIDHYELQLEERIEAKINLLIILYVLIYQLIYI